VLDVKATESIKFNNSAGNRNKWDSFLYDIIVSTKNSGKQEPIHQQGQTKDCVIHKL